MLITRSTRLLNNSGPASPHLPFDLYFINDPLFPAGAFTWCNFLLGEYHVSVSHELFIQEVLDFQTKHEIEHTKTLGILAEGITSPFLSGIFHNR